MKKFALSRTVVGACILIACGDSPGEPDALRVFLEGTVDDPQIGLVVTSTGRAFRMFQLGSPDTTRVVELGASSAVTPTGLAARAGRAAVPLGNAASVAVIDLDAERIERFFLFPSGNATGVAFVDDETVVVANLSDDYVGRFAVGQAGNNIVDTVSVAPAPTAVLASGGTAFVVSGNLDDTYAPIGHGVVTAIDPSTMDVIGTVSTGGNNAGSAAIGPDGLLYVINVENYVDPGSLAIIDPSTLALLEVIPGMGVGPGHIQIDANGVAYISGFFFGTLVWDTNSQSFTRGVDAPVCAALAVGGCRGAFGTASAANGDLYQLFFGSAGQGLDPWIFVYSAGALQLIDSIPPGVGPAAIAIETFVP